MDNMVHMESSQRQGFQRQGHLPARDHPNCPSRSRKLAHSSDHRSTPRRRRRWSPPEPPPQNPGPKCLIDASWHKEDEFFGGGMVLTTEDGMTTYGSFASNRVLTPLHAEFQTLLWAMKSSIQLDHNSMTFKTDCLQLVNLLEEDDEDKWPSLLAEFDEFHLICSMFTFCSISFTPRSLNFRADRLAKGARSRSLSFSHTNTQLPSWLAYEANLLVVT